MKVVVDDVRGEVFSTSSRQLGPRLVVELVGCLDMQTAPTLKLFLGQLLPHAESGAVDEVEFNIEQLYLLSSSAISCLATWLKAVRALEQACPVTFVTNANLGWQRRSLDPLRRLAEKMVRIQ
ncbi:MAG TPA: hypothetical protein VG937_32640 [Polyangiaceae bacterium]|jgi:hypothetical protein|nr:hypothetical protein [Polyangiaceae bacterium]